MTTFWWEKPLGAELFKERQESLTPAHKPARSPHQDTRMYASARADRLNGDFVASNSSADSELISSITRLRAGSRQLIRDTGYAKRAGVIVVNNIIGTGIGMQAQVYTSRDSLAKSVNTSIEEAWKDWSVSENCHTGGRLAFNLLERAAMAQVFAAGECFIRKHYRPFGKSSIPFALELIEAERIADELTSPYLSAQNGNHVRMGVEVDDFYRPVAYFIRRRHPNEYRLTNFTPDMVERVPANQIIHLAIIDRWPQTRGEPWMHAVAQTFRDTAGYTRAEIVRARAQASVPWTIETDPQYANDWGQESENADGEVDREMSVEPGVAKRLNPGEKMNAPAPNSPNPALDPFMRQMLREKAAGIGVSYEALSRDYSQSNYSSSRLALLDDRDTWRFYQCWFISEFRQPIHREWLQQAVLSRAIPGVSVEQYATDPKKFESVRFKPRGWSWIDPTKEVEASKEAVKQGFTTVSDVVSQNSGGLDLEDILATRQRELQLMEEAGLVFETSPDFYMAKAKEPAAAPGADPKEPAADEADEAVDDAEEDPNAQSEEEPTSRARTRRKLEAVR
jgi:lambda family phage portal protein